jgi:hypothetical protein
MKCKICDSEAKPVYKAKILGKYDIQYFDCPSCGFIQTEAPYWLHEAYSDAISTTDTGVMLRNETFSKMTSVILRLLKLDSAGKFLDFGGGYGIFTRLMRDRGFNFFWYDKFAENLLSRGFEGSVDNQKYEVVTSFENFEHFSEPKDEILGILKMTDYILFSTELVPSQAIPVSPETWWYFCLEHGQHISLFSEKSLQTLAAKNNLYYVTNGTNLHLLSKVKVSKNIFFFAKVICKLRLEKFFYLKSKTVEDMHKIQKAIAKDCKI